MINKFLYITTSLFCFFVLSIEVLAQNPVVSNVKFQQRNVTVQHMVDYINGQK